MQPLFRTRILGPTPHAATRPIFATKGCLRGRIIVSRVRVSILTSVNRCCDSALMLLHQSLALLDILRPLRTSALIIVFAAIDIFAKLLLALLCKLSGTLAALLRKHGCLFLGVLRA